MRDKKNLRQVSVLISAQTLWNLGRLAKMAGYGDNIGKVVDKLVRDMSEAPLTVISPKTLCAAWNCRAAGQMGGSWNENLLNKRASDFRSP